MCALVAPVVNSYKRLVPGYEAPVAGSWGRHSRGALIRVPTPIRQDAALGEVFGTRLELRLPDPSCNPYLAYTVMLAAGLTASTAVANSGRRSRKSNTASAAAATA